MYVIATDLCCSVLQVFDPLQFCGAVAALTHIPAAQLRLFPATPRITDVAIHGYTSRTVVIAAADEPPFLGRTWHAAVLDGRAILEEWMPIYVVDGSTSAETLLHSLRQSAPAGWLPSLNVQAGPHGNLYLAEGQVVVVDYYPEIPRAVEPRSARIPQAVFDRAPPLYTVRVSGRALPAGQLDPGDPDFVPFAAVFAVYAPDRVPLSVELALFGTESADAVLRTINAMRGAYDRGPLPGLMIVAPQPDPSHGIVLAVPDWQPPGVFVFFDCRHLEDRAFVALVPAGLDRAGILTIAGIDPSLNVRVYVRDAPHPLEPDFVFALQRGDLVQIAGPSHPPLVLAYFSDMIGDRASWEGAASPPGRYDARHWVVSEDGAFPVVPHPRGGETFRQQVAAEIGS